ncbi:MAG: vWA domain-containing protein [Sphingobacteriaceae bacterium]
MLQFAHIDFLWCLAAIPLLFVLFLTVTRWKKRAIARLGDFHVVKRMMPEVSLSRPWLKFIFFLLAFASLILGLANPQIGTKTEEVSRKGVDLMILLDVSNSMLAKDLAPNRLENAKRAISQLIDNLRNDRIGIVVFAGQAYVQLPVTTDYAAAKLFLNTINTDMVPTQGTAIGSAIDLGMQSFDFKNGMSKAMIIMTDGENHEDDAIAAAQNAHEKGVNIHVIGVGSAGGAPVPLIRNGKETGFHADNEGHTVVSKLDEKMCRQIAAAGKGVYVRATNAGTSLTSVMGQIAKMEQKEYSNKSFKDFEDRFQFFIAFALLILIIDFFIANKKNMKLSAINLFEVKKT